MLPAAGIDQTVRERAVSCPPYRLAVAVGPGAPAVPVASAAAAAGAANAASHVVVAPSVQ